MANTFVERIKLILSGAKKATRDAKKFETGLKKIQNAAVMAGGSFFAAQGLIEGFKHIINLSMETEKVAQGFMNLGKEFDISRTQLGKLREAVNGTMNDMELMTISNQAMTLGVAQSTDEMANLLDVAQRLGSALGVDTKQAVDSLVTGMGRNSIQLLDNLGIIVKQEEAQARYAVQMGITDRALTEQEKKLAFNAEAMRQATKAVEALGDEQLSTSEKIEGLTTRIETGFAASGEVAKRAIGAMVDGLSNIGLVAEEGRIGMDRFILEMFALEEIKSIDVMANEIRGLMVSMNDLSEAGDIEKWTEAWDEASTSGLDGFKERIGMMSDFITKQEEAGVLNEYEISLLKAYMEELGEMLAMEEIKNNFKKEELEVITELNDQLLRYNSAVIKSVEATSRFEEATPWINNLKQGLNDIVVYSQNASGEITKTGLAIGLSAKSSSEAVSQASEEFITAYIQQAIAIMIQKAFGEVGFFGGLAVAAGSAGLGRTIARGIQSIKAAEGMNEIVTEPTLILAGEAGPEYVDIEPTVNEGAGRGGANIVFQGNIMSDDFIEEQAIPKIKEALRRGADIGI